jgi:DNA-binding response OmpR family regulator
MQTTSGKAKRILVADDDPVIRKLITRFVEKEGFEPVVVNDGGAAYRLLKSDADFCGAVLDMMMPHLEGLDVIRFMSTEKRLQRIPVMMVTSEQDLKLMANSFAAGVTLFLSKPFTSEQFQMTFRLLVNRNDTRTNGRLKITPLATTLHYSPQ